MRTWMTTTGLILAALTAATHIFILLKTNKRKNSQHQTSNSFESQTSELKKCTKLDSTKITSLDDVLEDNLLHSFQSSTNMQKHKDLVETKCFHPTLASEDDEYDEQMSLTFYNSGLIDCFDLDNCAEVETYDWPNRRCSPIVEVTEDEDSMSSASSSSDLVYSEMTAKNHNDNQFLVDFDDDPDFQQLLLHENAISNQCLGEAINLAQNLDDNNLSLTKQLDNYAETISNIVVKEAIGHCPRVRPTKSTHIGNLIKARVKLKIKKRPIKFGNWHSKRRKKIRYAFVTTITNPEEERNAVQLGQALKHLQKKRRPIDRCVLIEPHFKSILRQLLSDVFTHVYYASEICSNDDLALTLLGKPEVASTFAKIHCWRLTQYTKCVYLEADTLVLQNCDDLFEREELSAVPDVGWPDCFNAGVFVFRPSLNTYAQLISLVNSTNKYNFQGGDQSLLNTYFKDWRNDLTKRLPFVYNVFPNQQYTYAPALKYFSSGIKIIHYYKPWSASWPSESSGPSTDLMDNWAAIFKNKVVPKLPESTQELVRNSKSGSATQLLQRMEQSPSVISHIPSAVSHISSTISHISSTISHISSAKSSYHSPQSTNVNVESSSSFEWKPDHSSPDNIWNVSHLEKPDYKSESAEQISHYETPSSANAEPLDPYWEAVLWDSVKSPWDPPLPVQVQDFPSSFTERGAQEDVSSPTFGWFSSDSGAQQSTFDEPRTAPQPFPEELASISSDIKEIELGPETEERSTERMKAWEEGKIDYLGKDRFDNIWRRLEGLLRDPEEIEPEHIEEFVDDSLEFSEDHFEAELLHGTNEEEVICEDEAAVPEADSISVGYPGYAEGDWSGMYEWQEGRIDYTGKDRSDNILKRLDLVMSGGVVPSAITRFDL